MKDCLVTKRTIVKTVYGRPDLQTGSTYVNLDDSDFVRVNMNMRIQRTLNPRTRLSEVKHSEEVPVTRISVVDARSPFGSPAAVVTAVIKDCIWMCNP
jgi:hypothetical protein